MQITCAACGQKNRVPDARLRDGPVCGACGAALADPVPVALDDRTFGPYVAGTDAPVVVDFWAAWCGPCRMMAPQFAAAAARLPDVRFAKVDTEQAQAVAARFGIRSIPTLAVFYGGREIARQSGAMPADAIVRWVNEVLAQKATARSG